MRNDCLQDRRNAERPGNFCHRGVGVRLLRVVRLCYWTTRLSKLVSQPLLLPMVTVAHGCVQFVLIVTWLCAASVAVTVVWPRSSA